MQRILLLHGYIEDSTIFDSLRPLLPTATEVVPIELEQAAGHWRPDGPSNVVALAQHLARHYTIGPTDVLIGHSMGGWIAAYVKELTGAAAILINSFTDQRKIVSDLRNPRVLGWYAWLGLMQSRFMRRRWKQGYQFEESRVLHAQLVDRSVRFRRRYMHQQLQVLFAPVPPLTTAPDLRVHSRQDNVILPPDEPFVEIPGDHFAHVFYPQPAAAAIQSFIQKQMNEPMQARLSGHRR
ncbi:alpha/beta fold hydrolase [Hymenobacter terrenus]|uniref:alpha/beta fold hydrolase n=1 Tax=Hymenobacter terrenus TaxID=1629124 RepID=UPI0006971FFD|nr:alpha/beta hydrolase [Hymenobacter terrenus]